jgi:hypothetical protein
MTTTRYVQTHISPNCTMAGTSVAAMSLGEGEDSWAAMYVTRVSLASSLSSLSTSIKSLWNCTRKEKEKGRKRRRREGKGEGEGREKEKKMREKQMEKRMRRRMEGKGKRQEGEEERKVKKPEKGGGKDNGKIIKEIGMKKGEEWKKRWVTNDLGAGPGAVNGET